MDDRGRAGDLADWGDDGANEGDGETRAREEPGEAEGVEGRGAAGDPKVRDRS